MNSFSWVDRFLQQTRKHCHFLSLLSLNSTKHTKSHTRAQFPNMYILIHTHTHTQIWQQKLTTYTAEHALERTNSFFQELLSSRTHDRYHIATGWDWLFHWKSCVIWVIHSQCLESHSTRLGRYYTNSWIYFIPKQKRGTNILYFCLCLSVCLFLARVHMCVCVRFFFLRIAELAKRI
jgi:hypothetical protein